MVKFSVVGIPKFIVRIVPDGEDLKMSTANEYSSCKGTKLLQELNLVFQLNLSSIVESKRNLNCDIKLYSEGVMALGQYIQRTHDSCLELYPNKFVQTRRKRDYFILHKLYFS